jgi:RNA polymerase sigma-70 factor, ECF subfamily
MYYPYMGITLIGIEVFYCKAMALLDVLYKGLLFFANDNSSNQLSDNQLAELAKTDSQHFEELFDRYFPRVYQFFYFRLRHTQNAEDLTSEVFIKIYEKIELYKDTGAPFGAWVFSIARNTFIDFTRKNKEKIESLEEIPPSAEPSTNFDLTKINHKICMEKLWSAMRLLPQKQQELWALKLTSDLPHKEIANILGTTENNVNVMVNRSLKELKKRLSYLSKDI